MAWQGRTDRALARGSAATGTRTPPAHARSERVATAAAHHLTSTSPGGRPHWRCGHAPASAEAPAPQRGARSPTMARARPCGPFAGRALGVLLVLALCRRASTAPAAGLCTGRRTRGNSPCACRATECYSCAFTASQGAGDCVSCQNGAALLDTVCIPPWECVAAGGSLKGTHAAWPQLQHAAIEDLM